MSLQAITAAMPIQGLTSSEKLVLIVLANYATDDNEAWPSHAALARVTGFTDRGIRKILGALVTKGLVTTKGRHGKSGQTSNLYTLHFVPEPRSVTLEEAVQSGSATPRNQVPPPPERRSDEPVRDTSIETSARASLEPCGEVQSPALEERKKLAADMRALAKQLGAQKSIPPPRRASGRPVQAA